MSLKGKSVAITGGGTGIGAGIARSLAMAGAKVIIGGRRLEKLTAFAATVDSETPIATCTLDVADNESIDQFFATAQEHVGDIDILVNSAGINIVNRTMADMDPEQWDEVMRVNATGAYRCMHKVLPAMRRRRDGLVVNISSIAGKRAITLGGVVYCASKFAMTAMGTAVANEVR
ncbi:MAG: SDR family oxidoreductase, partial [Planctomycetota bacterium]